LNINFYLKITSLTILTVARFQNRNFSVFEICDQNSFGSIPFNSSLFVCEKFPGNRVIVLNTRYIAKSRKWICCEPSPSSVLLSHPCILDMFSLSWMNHNAYVHVLVDLEYSPTPRLSWIEWWCVLRK